VVFFSFSPDIKTRTAIGNKQINQTALKCIRKEEGESQEFQARVKREKE